VKKTLFITLSLVIITISFLISASTVFAYSYTTGKHWESGETFYDHSSLPSDWQSEINAAAWTWDNSASSFNFYYDSSSENDIVCEEWGQGYVPAWAPTIPDGNNHIIEARITFNTSYPYSTDRGWLTLDVQTIALHELGHWLVLDDLYGMGNMSKIMYYVYYYIEKHTLTSDDINGICYIYP